MTYRLFLDDMRDMPPGEWLVARSYGDFVQCVTEYGVPAFVSFDHDLADEHYAHCENPIPYSEYSQPTGRDCALWLAEHCAALGVPLPDFTCHSMNPAGRHNIEKIMTGKTTA